MNDSSYFFDGAKDYQGEQQDRDWQADDDTLILTQAAINAVLDEARIQRESDFEAFCADMADIPEWPTQQEIEEYEAEYRMRYAA